MAAGGKDQSASDGSSTNSPPPMDEEDRHPPPPPPWTPSSEEEEWASCDGGSFPDMKKIIDEPPMNPPTIKTDLMSRKYVDSYDLSPGVGDMRMGETNKAFLLGEERPQGRLARNPSYHAAIKDREYSRSQSPPTEAFGSLGLAPSGILASMEELSSREPSPLSYTSDITTNTVTSDGTANSNNSGSSSVFGSASSKEDDSDDNISQGTVREALPIYKNHLTPLMVEKTSTSIGRSVSFSERLLTKEYSPNLRNKSSLTCYSECNSRRTSTADSPEVDATPTQGRPVRRLLSTPSRLTSVATSPTGSLSLSDSETSSVQTSPFYDRSSRKSISRLTSSIARKLSFNKTAKVTTRFENNYFQQNGLMEGSLDGVVSWEGLVRLFQCPGCQTFMFPPLNQCRKGHLICAACRTALKHICPVCRQRFAENTNLMMEQVRIVIYKTKIH